VDKPGYQRRFYSFNSEKWDHENFRGGRSQSYKRQERSSSKGLLAGWDTVKRLFEGGGAGRGEILTNKKHSKKGGSRTVLGGGGGPIQTLPGDTTRGWTRVCNPGGKGDTWDGGEGAWEKGNRW